jgi:hypothetical protein
MADTRKRNLSWLLLAVALGTIVLPVAVYFTGVTVLGPYANGGLPQFMGDFLADLVHLRRAAVAIALGPAVMVALFAAFIGAFRR